MTNWPFIFWKHRCCILWDQDDPNFKVFVATRIKF